MAGKVQVYTDQGNALSEREYTEYQVTAIRKPDRPDWTGYHVGNDEGVNLTLFRDEETGLMTTDPSAFEKWLKTIPAWGKRD